MSARADIAPSGVVSVGAAVGGHDHPDDAGSTIGVDLDAALRFGMFTVGGSIGYDTYAPLDGVPVHARTMAGRAGVEVPLAATAPNRAARVVQFDALGALEVGQHHYSPEGERKQFLGSTTTYQGGAASLEFVGLRVGAAMTIHHEGSVSGLIFKLELIGRHDLGGADLAYDKTSCGGLFSSANECSGPTHDMTRVGGTELGVTTSVGVVFGE